MVKFIHTELAKSYNQRVSKKHILDSLEDYLSESDAERVLKIAIEWGRYAESFAYDDKAGELNMENPE